MRKWYFLLFLSSSAFGSASIQMTGVSVAADGQTVTINTNCSTACSPTSGITGFTIGATQNGISVAFTNVTATASGTTITLVVTPPILRSADATTTISLATVGGGSNLTDGASNTPTGQSNYSIATDNSEWYAAGGTAFLNSAVIDNGTNVRDTYPQTIRYQTFDGKIRFTADITGINVFAFEYNADYVLMQDSVPIANFGTYSTSIAFSTANYITGLSGTHTYEIVEVYGSGYIGIPALSDIELVSVRITGSLGGAPAAKWPLVTECGDSLVSLGGSDHILDTRNGHMWLSSYGQGITDQAPGASGDSIIGGLSLNSQCATWLTNFGQNPVIDYLEGGGNDIESAASTTTFATAVDTYVYNVQNNVEPPQHVVFEGIIYSSNFYTDADTDKYTSIIATETAKSANACYADRRNWIGTTQDRQSDGIHLNAAGEILLANNLMPITAGYVLGKSYSVSGPASGGFNTPSTNFTVTRATGTWAGAITQSSETITLSDNGAGGSFVISGGTTVGTDPVAVTPTVGNSSFTFTYSTLTGGVKTLSFTNNRQCWTDPPSLQYSSPGNNFMSAGSSKFSGSAVLQ